MDEAPETQTDAETDALGPKAKRIATFGDLAVKDLARARRAAGAEWKIETGEGRYWLEQAKIHAMLDLAAALRDSR